MRKASGFLTTNGDFYNTKPEAEAAEAAYRFHAAFEDHVRVNKVPEVVREILLDNVRAFVLTHRDEITAYMKHIASIPVLYDPEDEAVHTEQRLVQLSAPVTAPVTDTEDSPSHAFVQTFLDTLGEDDGS